MARGRTSSSPKLGRFNYLEERPQKHAPFLKQRMKACLNQWLGWEYDELCG